MRTTKEKHKRQVVIIVVEGQSDENALVVPLTEAFEQKYGEDTQVFFAQIRNDDGTKGGDITSRNGVVPDKLHMLMNKLIIMPCITENNLMPKYVTEIVHIIDTDGAYIPDESIVQGNDETGDRSPCYCSDTIIAPIPEYIVDRNDRKRKNIAALLAFQKNGFEIQNYVDTAVGNKPTTKATRVPYSLYYFSCNLDHFICGEANLDKYRKVQQANDFAMIHGNDLESFLEYLAQDSDATIGMTHEESWELLKSGTESLHRHTNINLLFGGSCTD